MSWFLFWRKRKKVTYTQVLDLATEFQATKKELTITEMRSALTAIVAASKSLEKRGYDATHLFKD